MNKETKKTANIISLGAGVQSSTMLVLYYKGILKPMPDAAIFADTQSEPKEVYEYLNYIKEKVKDKIPVIIATKGNLAGDHLDETSYIRRNGYKFATIPLFHKDEKGKVKMGMRQCTNDYKIGVVQKALREFLGYKKYARMKHHIYMNLGISTDEITRMKESRVKWITNKFPLIDEMKWSRQDCINFMEKEGFKRPPRSACWMCPYKTDKEWVDMKNEDKDSWDKAVEFDKKLRKNKKFANDNYVHRSCVPLDKVKFKPKKKDNPHTDGLADECEGMCGM